MPADILINVAVVAVAVIAAVVLLTSVDARTILSVAVGVTGGLQTSQIGKVHYFCVAVVLWLLLGPLREPRRAVRLDHALLVPLSTGLLALTVLTGSLTNNPVVAVQLLLLACAATLFSAFGDADDVRAALAGLFLVTTYASLYGILQYVGVLPHELFEGQNRPIGIYLEPDWLGMFSAIGLLLSFHVRQPVPRYAAAAVNVVAVLLAAARASWIALAVVGVLALLTARRVPESDRPRGAWRLTGFGVAAGAVLLASIPSLTTLLVTRLEGASTTGPDVSAKARQQQVASLLHLESIAPWNGLGLSASGRVGVSGPITYIGEAQNNVASNWVLGWWVDGKLLAVPLIAIFAVFAFVRLNRISGRVLAIVLISSLFSNAMYIPVAWLALGACLADGRTGPAGARHGWSSRDPTAPGDEPRSDTEVDDLARRSAMMEGRT
jgi:hypothetical protein